MNTKKYFMTNNDNDVTIISDTMFETISNESSISNKNIELYKKIKDTYIEDIRLGFV